MDSEKSYTAAEEALKRERLDRRFELARQHEIRVELPAIVPVVDVTPFCGPAGDLVRVNWYELTRDVFLTAGGALAVAEALRTAALKTANPPEPVN